MSLRSRGLVALVGALALLLAACTSGTGGTPAGQAPAPAVEGLLWSGDAETGDLSQFEDTPWNVVGGTPPAVVKDPVRGGTYAIALGIEGPTTSDDGICCGSRDEIQPKFRNLVSGDDLWFGFSTYLGDGFPTDAYWQVIMQFKQNFDGSPPLSLNVEGGQFKLEGGEGHPDDPEPFVEPLADATTGQWADWLMHVKFSADPDEGFIEVWKDGQQVLDRYQPAGGTLYPAPDGDDASYVKFGYYREAGIEQPGSIFFDNWRIGTIRAAVTPSPTANPTG